MYAISCYVIMCYDMLYYVMVWYVMICMLYHVTLCYIMISYVMLWYVMLCYVMFDLCCYIMSWGIMSCYIMLCYVMLSSVMLYHVMLRYCYSSLFLLSFIFSYFHLFESSKHKTLYIFITNFSWLSFMTISHDNFLCMKDAKCMKDFIYLPNP